MAESNPQIARNYLDKRLDEVAADTKRLDINTARIDALEAHLLDEVKKLKTRVTKLEKDKGSK